MKVFCKKCETNLRVPTNKIQDKKKRKWKSLSGIQICWGCDLIMIVGNNVKDIILVPIGNEEVSIPHMRRYYENDSDGITLPPEGDAS